MLTSISHKKTFCASVTCHSERPAHRVALYRAHELRALLFCNILSMYKRVLLFCNILSMYMHVYRHKLQDAGLVEKHGCCGSEAGMLRSCVGGHLNANATKLRRLRVLYALVALALGLSISVYLLVVSIQGYFSPSLQSKPQKVEGGIVPPLFGVCHNVYNIVQFQISNAASNEPGQFEVQTLVESAQALNLSPIYYTNKTTLPLPSMYSAGSAPSCFSYQLLPQLIPSQISALINALKNDFPAFTESSWRPCAVCYAPVGVKKSLDMRFDFALPVQLPPLEQLSQFAQMQSSASIAAFTTGFWMALNCSNAVMCPGEA